MSMKLNSNRISQKQKPVRDTTSESKVETLGKAYGRGDYFYSTLFINF